MLKRGLLSIGAIVALALVFTAGLVSGRVTKRSKAPDLNDPDLWLPIKVFQGILGPSTGKVDATVSAILRLSDGPDTYTLMQNKIEIQTNEGFSRFLWPDDGTFVAGWCDILDVDGDGEKEFLLYAGGSSLRIVSFAQGKFQFRRNQDDLLSFDHGVGPLDLNGDGKLEFLEDEHFPSSLDNPKWIWIPRVKRWSRSGGFMEVSKEYPRYYKDQVIPELQRRLSSEKDLQVRETISQAVTFIETEILR